MKKYTIPFFILYGFAFIIINTCTGKVPFMFFYLLTVILITSLIYLALCVILCKHTQSIDSRVVVKGDIVKFYAVISNETIFYIPFIHIKFINSGNLFVSEFGDKYISLKPNTSIKLEYELNFKYRGDFEVGLDYIEFSDFFNIVGYRREIKNRYSVRVHPKVVNIFDIPIGASLVSETSSLIRSGVEDYTTISDFRKYAQGDSIKKIHWKLSAKMNEWYVKNFEHTSAFNIVIVLDLKKLTVPEYENIVLQDKIIEVTLSTIHFCLQNNITVELIYFGKGFVSTKGADFTDFPFFYELLSEIKFGSSVDSTSILDYYLEKVSERSNMMMITSNLDKFLGEKLISASRSGHKTMVSSIYLAGLTETDKHIKESLTSIGISVFDIEANQSFDSKSFTTFKGA